MHSRLMCCRDHSEEELTDHILNYMIGTPPTISFCISRVRRARHSQRAATPLRV
jgi:hypothetical protein